MLGFVWFVLGNCRWDWWLLEGLGKKRTPEGTGVYHRRGPMIGVIMNWMKHDLYIRYHIWNDVYNIILFFSENICFDVGWNERRHPGGCLLSPKRFVKFLCE